MPGVRALTRPRFLLAAALAGVAAGLVGIAMALLLAWFAFLSGFNSPAELIYAGF